MGAGSCTARFVNKVVDAQGGLAAVKLRASTDTSAARREARLLRKHRYASKALPGCSMQLTSAASSPAARCAVLRGHELVRRHSRRTRVVGRASTDYGIVMSYHSGIESKVSPGSTLAAVHAAGFTKSAEARADS